MKLKRSVGLLVFLLLKVLSAYSQPAGCDEGVIRLPDRTGTIQICSALAARVPELAKQLSQATALIGSQQAQLSELTRLVRGLNNVSRGIGLQRQAGMMESLSAELLKGQRDSGPDALTRINQRLDNLQVSLLGAMSDPKMANALGEALKGPLGDAISKMDLTGASKQIEDIAERLKVLQSSVNEVRTDTTAIRQQLAQMDQRQQVLEIARINREEATVGLLKRLSGEIRELGQRGGLIDEPRNFAAHYHNARILSQRGEVDLAVASYRQVFKTGFQMADPVVDITTLLIRQYGRQGAARAFARDFQSELPKLSYLYGLQLLADKELEDVEDLLFSQPELIADFPPLASIYLRRLHDRIARKSGAKINVYTFQWSDTAGMGKVAQILDKEIESGNYLAFYIDQIRGGRDLDDFRAVSEAFTKENILRVGIPNLSSSERFTRQTVDLSNSPIVFDYTYFFDAPSNEVAADLAREASYMPKYKKGSVFTFVWDAALDPLKPVHFCAVSSGKELCKDINESNMRCKAQDGRRAINCTRTNFIGGERNFSPYLEAHFVAQDLLGVNCISKVKYTTKQGKEISISSKNLVSGFRRSVDDDVDKLMNQCAYDFQGEKNKAKKSEVKHTLPTFSSANKSDTQVANNKNNCQQLGKMVFPATNLGVVLVRHRMNSFRVKVAAAINSLPEVPSFDNEGSRFDESDNKCKINLVVKGESYVCAVSSMVTSRWLPAVSPVKSSSMINPAEIWNSGIFPDPTSPVECDRRRTKSEDELSKKSVSKSVTIDQIKLLENSTMADQLEAFGAGNNANCQTIGYTGIIFRIRIDLGLRAIDKNTCDLGSSLRKTKLEAGQLASSKQFNGCFTSGGMSNYLNKVNELLVSASKDCSSSLAKEAKDYAKNAAEWALEQP
jgi:hypothetical protein